MSAYDRWLTHDPREEWPPDRPDECRCDRLDEGDMCGPCERAIEEHDRDRERVRSSLASWAT